ncbi:hypothetical protein AB0N87_20690 [Streptomyces sp. NPDC093228]|uniref:hypothetical protein n=1 Tax=unclassified Streptomyces TaxID=2593676 RepID=UPI00074135E3|nr:MULTISPECIES: hypothetical protein [unclassified Streptomyces]KUJ47506.1 hypothetical protein ADL25_11375 [Streptomyces sp. NRRL F-5122]MDX3263601.1 hypothetical protein [Streptomyces sp. MI02-2A]REE64959.1 hypothetical protein BX257_7668 [Streptomyces sp. 3212.3]
MNKLVRRLTTAGVSAAFLGGALFAAGGSAIAATPQTPGHAAVRSTVVADTKVATVHTQHRVDPWIADQIAMFDPWVVGQLEDFVPSGGTGGQHGVSDWHRSLDDHTVALNDGARP